jgi:hypothetical protein
MLPNTARGWFDYYYPFFSTEGDSRFMSEDTIAIALAVAESFAPNCPAVSEAQIMQATAHYAAYELNLRYENMRAGSGFSTESVLIREKQGDVERAYSAPKTTVTSMGAQGDDSPFGRWQAIANLCPSVFNGFSLRSQRI